MVKTREEIHGMIDWLGMVADSTEDPQVGAAMDALRWTLGEGSWDMLAEYIEQALTERIGVE